MFHGLSVPYIGETELSVKKPAVRTVRASLEQLSKKQLEWICISGVELAVAHLIIGLFFCITIVGIPFGKQHFKLAQVALMPFGTYTF